jgi:hypothetical protein
MPQDVHRIKHLIIGAVVGAFLALTIVMPRADAQAERGAPRFEVDPVRENDQLYLIILDHGDSKVYRRFVKPEELQNGKHLELLIREQWRN